MPVASVDIEASRPSLKYALIKTPAAATHSRYPKHIGTHLTAMGVSRQL